MRTFLKEENISKINFISQLSIIVLLSFGMGYLFVTSYYREFKTELKIIEEDYIRIKKEKIKDIVDLEVSEFDIKHNQMTGVLKNDLKKKVYTAHKIAEIVYNTYQGKLSSTELVAIIKKSIRFIHLDNGASFYLIDKEGNCLQLNCEEEISSTFIFNNFSILDTKDFVRKIRHRTKIQNEGFFQYKLKGNPSQKDEPAEIGFFFFKRFAKMRWMIGSNSNLESIRNQTKRDTINALQKSRIERNGNKFKIYEIIGNLDQQPRLKLIMTIRNPETIGREFLLSDKDTKGNLYVKELITKIKYKKGVFMQYWEQKKIDQEPELKYGYFRYYPQWNWVIAKEFYLQDLEKLKIQVKAENLKKNIWDNIRSAIGLFLFFIVLAILLSISFSNQIAKIFNAYKRKVEKNSVEMDLKNIQLQKEIKEKEKVTESLQHSEKKLRMLAADVQISEERERRRIAGDLHDSIGSALAISNLKLEMLSGKSENTEFIGDIELIHKNIKQVIQETRSLTFQLSPPVLYEVGLEAAIASLAEKTELQHGIKTIFENDNEEKYLPEDTRVHLFRSVRELLLNVIKYAKASQIKISIRKINEQIVLDVSDNGVGFKVTDQSTTPEIMDGFGLFSIRERLKLLGGNINIKSELGKGTIITLQAPISKTH